MPTQIFKWEARNNILLNWKIWRENWYDANTTT